MGTTETAGDTVSGPITIPLKALVRVPEYQVRKGLDRATVARYVTAYLSGREMPPITVGVGLFDGKFVLLDGHHRCAALEKIGRKEVRAVPVRVTPREAGWEAAKANLSHGKPLARSEYEKAFKLYIRARQHIRHDGRYKSYREITRELGGPRSHMTIHGWMKRHFPKIADAMSTEQGDRRAGRGKPLEDEMDPLMETGMTALQTVEEVYSSLSDEVRRSEFLDAVRQTVALIETMPAGALKRTENPDF